MSGGKAPDAPLVVVGGGLIGPVLALFLARAGHRVAVYDRRPDPRRASQAGGRSINLTLCERGFRALDRVGAAEPLRRLAIPARGRILHQADGATELQPYGNQGEAIYSIVRRDIHQTLLSLAEAEPGVELFFDHACVDLEGIALGELGLDNPDPGETIDPEQGLPVLTFRHGGRRVRVEAERVFGCDGAYSAVRSRMQRLDRFDYSQAYVPQGYKELHVPAAADGSHRLDPHAIHVWPRGRHMLIGFANRDGSFTLALHLPFEGEPSFASMTDGDALLALFERDFADALPLVPDLRQSFRQHPVTSMVTIRCRPWSVGDRVLLVGDSAHAIVPSYGQGANCGFEDCAVLADCLAASPGDWGAVFGAFERRRKADADAIAELALEHFDELQVWVGEPLFLRRKAIERRVQALFPDRFQSLYGMVSFTTLSYSAARARATEQQGLIDHLLEQSSGSTASGSTASGSTASGSTDSAAEVADIEDGALDAAIRHAVSQLPPHSDDPSDSPRGER